jgi:superoxide dismutase, Cu-Zn family
MKNINTRIALTAALAGLGMVLLVSAPRAQSAPKAASAVVADASGIVIGVAHFLEVADGTRITLRVQKGLTPGKHGVHVHSKSSCADAPDATTGANVKFGGAGTHLDPLETKKHGGPTNTEKEAHAGDIPNIEIMADGRGTLEFTTKKLTVSDGPLSLKSGAIVVHANEDKYTNDPPLGGSGPRVACGTVRLEN